jgi:Mn2+/Fe2+ NRAMP family transporter
LRLRQRLSQLGPGIAIAATGVGAGDLLAAMIAGAEVGTVLLWAIVWGALLKFALNEGIARWQLATGETFLEGWFARTPRALQLCFLGYLALWGFIVAAGLMSACGVAAQALTGVGSNAAWAIAHSLTCAGLVLVGGYAQFEKIMRVMVGLMFVSLVTSLVLLRPDLGALLRGLVLPQMPANSAAVLLALMGGVGGSVTLLSYGYWIREREWKTESATGTVRADLALGYALTGIFGVAMLSLSAIALADHAGEFPKGSAGLVICAQAVGDAASRSLGPGAGPMLRGVFLVGIWSAVATSTLGVWQGVPYLFADAWGAYRREPAAPVEPRAKRYRLALLYLAVPPMILLAVGRPVWMIRLYTLTSGLFMPVLALSLLWMNNRQDWVGSLRNGTLARSALVLALLLFAAILFRQTLDLL